MRREPGRGDRRVAEQGWWAQATEADVWAGGGWGTPLRPEPNSGHSPGYRQVKTSNVRTP